MFLSRSHGDAKGFRTTDVAAHIDQRHRFSSTKRSLDSMVSLSTSTPILLYEPSWTALTVASCSWSICLQSATSNAPRLDVVVHAGLELELLHGVGELVDEHLLTGLALQLRSITFLTI